MKQVIIFLFFIITCPGLVTAQKTDTSILRKITLLPVVSKTILVQNDTSTPAYLTGNQFLNKRGTVASRVIQYKMRKKNEATFYLLAGLVFMLAFFRFFFTRYFNNLFKVFFNTSFRQSQLTDQLLQAKLPSLLLNLFFIICGGIYFYSLLSYYHLITGQNKWILMTLSIGILGLIYFVKYGILKFTGWITGFKDITNTYIFIIFMLNKIIGIFLLPFIILIAFSDDYIINAAVIISLLLIGFMLLMRFIRSYLLLQNQLKVSRFHFFLYVTGIELMPLLLIYKGLMLFLSKNM